MSQEMKYAEEIAQRLVKEVSGIDLVLVYGGVAQGRFGKYSDYDLIAISDKKWVVWEFVIDNQPICLWSVTWDNAEKMINGEDDFWSVSAATILDAKIVWAKSDKMIKKYEKLKEAGVDGGLKTLKKSIAGYDELYGKLWRLQKAIEGNKNLEVAFLKMEIVNGLTHTLAALNNQYFLNNWGKQLSEIETFEKVPDEFTEQYKKFLLAEPEEALLIGEAMINGIKMLIRNWLRSEENKEEQNDVGEIGTEWAGIIEWANKAYSATEKGDEIAGIMAAIENANTFMWAFLKLQNKKWDINSFYTTDEEILKLAKNIPKNIQTLLQSQNLVELKEATEELVQALKEELELRRIKLPVAETLDDAIQFIQEKER